MQPLGSALNVYPTHPIFIELQGRIITGGYGRTVMGAHGYASHFAGALKKWFDEYGLNAAQLRVRKCTAAIIRAAVTNTNNNTLYRAILFHEKNPKLVQ